APSPDRPARLPAPQVHDRLLEGARPPPAPGQARQRLAQPADGPTAGRAGLPRPGAAARLAGWPAARTRARARPGALRVDRSRLRALGPARPGGRAARDPDRRRPQPGRRRRHAARPARRAPDPALDPLAGEEPVVKRTSPTLIVPLIDVLLTLLALWLAEVARLGLPLGEELLPFARYLTATIGVAVALIWTASLVAFGVPESRPPTPWYVEFRNLFVALLFAVFALAGFFFLARIEHFSRLLYAYFVFLDGLFVVGFHLALRLRWRRDLRRGLGVSPGGALGPGA